jgi:hypothetical protein
MISVRYTYEAAELLMAKRHVMFLGCADIEQHRTLFDALAVGFCGQCALFCVEAEWRRTASELRSFGRMGIFTEWR